MRHHCLPVDLETIADFAQRLLARRCRLHVDHGRVARGARVDVEHLRTTVVSSQLTREALDHVRLLSRLVRRRLHAASRRLPTLDLQQTRPQLCVEDDAVGSPFGRAHIPVHSVHAHLEGHRVDHHERLVLLTRFEHRAYAEHGTPVCRTARVAVGNAMCKHLEQICAVGREDEALAREVHKCNVLGRRVGQTRRGRGRGPRRDESSEHRATVVNRALMRRLEMNDRAANVRHMLYKLTAGGNKV